MENRLINQPFNFYEKDYNDLNYYYQTLILTKFYLMG